jgi:hypothetical protein
VQRENTAIDLSAQREVQDRLREQLGLQGLVHNDRGPERAQGSLGQSTNAMDALRQVAGLVVTFRHGF